MATEPSNSENDPAPRVNARKAGHAIFDLVCALAIGMVAAWILPNSRVETDSQPQDSYYNLLVQGFRAGQLNVKKEVPPELRKIANPYDPHNPADSSQYIKDVTDLSYYHDKLYLYYGVTPALVLLWPYASLTGHYLADNVAVLVFFSLGWWIAAGLFRDVRRRYLPEASIGLVVAALFASGLSIALTLWCNTNEVAITCGFAFTMLAVAGIWRAMHEPKSGPRWLLLASLAYALAVGARPSLLFGVIILMIPAVAAWAKASGPDSYRLAGVLFLAAVIPAMLVGAGLMVYNDLRFDNPFDFGWRYQLNELYRPPTAKQFSLHYFWFNFRDYFVVPLRWNGDFPFLQAVPLPPVPSGYNNQVQLAVGAIPSTYPLVLLAWAVPLAWKNRPANTAVTLRWLAAALLLLFIICFFTNCLFFTAAGRYELDFLPALLLLACLGVLSLDRACAGRAAWRRIARWGFFVLLAYSLVLNSLLNVEARAEIDYLAGNAFLSVGQRDEAMIQYRKALALWPGSADAHFGIGSAFFRKGQLDDAIAQYEKTLEINPNFPEAHNNLGYCFLKTGRMDDAIVQYQKTLAILPDFAEARNNLAYCFLQVGQVDNAIAQYQQAVEIKPGSATYHCGLGNALLQTGRFNEATIEYQKALEIEPDFVEAHNYLAYCFFRTGRLDDAIIQYQKTLALKPDFAEAHSNLGSCLLQKGRVDDAIAEYRRAIELQPDFGQGYNNLGDALHRKGMEAQATAAYKKATELQQGK